MALYVAIGTSPFSDTSVTVGPFRSPDRALVAVQELEYRGYTAESCALQDIAEIEPLAGAPE